MSKVVEKLNQIQADALVLSVQFHNYHWNVKGSQFHAIHEATECAYTHLGELFDEVAERALMIGGKALVCPKELTEKAKCPRVKADSFSCKEVVELVKKDYTYLLEQFNELAEIADEADDRVTVALAEDNIAKYEKELWMLRQTLAE
ncbi:Dps family protein [Campylobacter corcagiensis]|uniref:DNA starvation/stationary phase protection protein n=1 Tax=Campylobacter corcagiensis TaxID=1448857 RepID=A0A7M1LDQ8_9BACT|nr:DNA starvation/stationary phase protection protein [Campylobacter corcagiensis]QKF65145.1 DNA-binding ferritin-like protein [Campylobacter corcagiensis]QOQ86712.1 DNA starvation/stationary phase protection protein [Campylobacter corcagiensis]